MLNKKVPYSIFITFLVGVLITIAISYFSGAYNRKIPEEELVDTTRTNDFLLSTAQQENTYEEWQVYNRYRALTGLRMTVFYLKSVYLAKPEMTTEMEEYLDSLVEVARDTASVPELTTNQTTKGNIELGLDLLDKGVAMIKDGVTSYKSYSPDDYFSGADSYFGQELYNLPINFYQINPTYIEKIVDYNESPDIYVSMRNMVLQQAANIFKRAIVSFNDTYMYEYQLDMLSENMAWTTISMMEAYNWRYGFIPPEDKLDEWYKISDMFGDAVDVMARYSSTDTWLTKTLYAEMRVYYETELNKLLAFIEKDYGITPQEEPNKFGPGAYYVDDFGLVRKGEVEPFYVLNSDGEYVQSTQEDWNSGVQLYKKTEDGEFIRIEEDGLEEAPISTDDLYGEPRDSGEVVPKSNTPTEDSTSELPIYTPAPIEYDNTLEGLPDSGEE